MNTPSILLNESFDNRHIGPSISEERDMLAAIGIDSLDELIDQTVPADIRTTEPLALPPGLSEHDYLQEIAVIAQHNRVLKSYIGLGYHPCIVPTVIQRNILENPGWYTQYTPYQAEIAQGRLEAMLTFQTLISDLTGMEIANASLLDEGTAAAEAMVMLLGIVHRDSHRQASMKCFVSEQVLLQTLDVIRTRAAPLGIEIVVGDHRSVPLDQSYFAAILQYPASDGAVYDYRGFIERAHMAGVKTVVAADLMSLVLLTPPGEFGADVVVGSAQRFGVPMGFGGPHAAFFATRSDCIRSMPGRIIGVSVDRLGHTGYRMTLQTREQHIRREKATSNICTAQALLAVMAGMYAVYHGAEGLRRIAGNIHAAACATAKGLEALGYHQQNEIYFDTLKVAVPNADHLRECAERNGMNFRYIDQKLVCIALNETTTAGDVHDIISVFAEAAGLEAQDRESVFNNLDLTFPLELTRTTTFLTHPVFNMNRSETEMLRYIKRLENRDLSLTHSMIPLGSCTMKLNATSEMVPITWPQFSNIHPFAPADQVQGYLQVIRELEEQLCTITGFPACSLQPNSGAQGEYSGLLVIRAYHEYRGEGHRDVVLIPQSAHGTNPASAVMAGYHVVVVACDVHGNISTEDLEAKARQYHDRLAAFMVTYPSTHGVFEHRIRDFCRIVHEHGGQVYMDGANLNAQVGLTTPALIGADVCHINLHKTFSIPHGGGGPGMGPICVAGHLAPFLPSHQLVKTGGKKGIHAVASAPWGSASILLISYAYIRMLGGNGCTDATRFAILNANYLKSLLEKHYDVLYQGTSGRVAHEFIIDLRPFKSAGVEAEDVAKRLIDYGFHAPTVAFPVAGTLMIEPTESESKAELDRFADAMISIRQEIQEIVDGLADKSDNVLKNAPHTAQEALSELWQHPYSRYKAVYPLPFLKHNKFWPHVARVNNSYGDRNIMCVCPPIEDYIESVS